ncbi:MAG: AAA domain-containing protein [Firmicutes bacterium]|nr:AAA domain-containing protein [Bacillota bacterium]
MRETSNTAIAPWVMFPTEVLEYLDCRHRLSLWKRAAEGAISVPPKASGVSTGSPPWHGTPGERRTLISNSLEALEKAFQNTQEALRRGDEHLLHPVLWDRPWLAMPDMLVRVNAPSSLGAYRYDVVKLLGSQESVIDALLIAALEADLLHGLQGASTAIQLKGSDGSVRSFSSADVVHYVRRLKNRLYGDLTNTCDSYPDPVPACRQCLWLPVCEAQRRQDDHLTYVAEITRTEMRALQKAGIRTLTALAETTATEIPGLSSGALERLKRQAQIQLQGKLSGSPVMWWRSPSREDRLQALPPPSRADLFVVMSIDEPAGEELKGWEIEWVEAPLEDGPLDIRCRRANTLEEGSTVLLEILERANRGLSGDSSLHLYHFGPDLPNLLKQLTGRYGVGEALLDNLLRADAFFDLKAYARERLWVSEEEYSLGALAALVKADESAPIPNEDLKKGTSLALYVLYRGLWVRSSSSAALRVEPSKATSVRVILEEGRAEELKHALMAGVPPDPGAWSQEHRARWLLSELIRWHRREERAAWWQYFANLAMDPEEALESPGAIEGLTLVRHLGVRVELTYPPQEHKLKVGDKPVNRETGKTVGEIAALDPLARRLILDLPPGAPVPRTLAVPKPLPTEAMKEAVAEVAQVVVARGLAGPGPYRALRRLLGRYPPTIRGVADGALLRDPAEPANAAARRLALALDQTVLPIQGPPGTGKTHTGAQLIVDLVRAGKRVGVTAVSHQVISHLVDQVARLANLRGAPVRIVQKAPMDPRVFQRPPGVSVVCRNQELEEAFRRGRVDVVAGTAWLFSRSEWREVLDVLVIDEAGQFALAQALAVGTAAHSLILLGDPQQLSEPTQGHHPPGVDISVLAHLLNQEDTIRDHQGIFLDVTYRMHPAIGTYISRIAYEGRLKSHPRCATQALDLEPPWLSAGLAWIPVHHEGNRTVAPEEAIAIQKIVARLLGRQWYEASGETRPIGWEDILVVAPYNAQVMYLHSVLPKARVGTVDKFQGQEAPVVIYSLTTSTAEDAPHGTDFLYSLNRLNVALSRAQGLAIVVANPSLLLTKPTSMEHLRVLNALCLFVEEATEIALEV